MSHLMQHLLTSPWALVAVFLVNMISAAGIPAGSEWATIGAGALAGGAITRHHPALFVVILIAIAGDVSGSIIGYFIGRIGGRPLVDKLGRYVLVTPKEIDRAEAWFARRGDPIVLFGRAIPLLRSFVSLAAGISEMSLAKFLLFSGIGITAFATLGCSLGYALGPSYHRLLNAFTDANYVVAAVVVVAFAAFLLHRIRGARQAS